MAERDDDGLLARWSRRKAAARRGELEPESEATLDAPVEPAPRAQAAEALPTDQPPPDLPDPDTLDASADFKAYLKPGVPPELKTRALRRLWRVDPFYSRHDGLDDCCGDFTDSARVVKNLKTVYQVGRGMIDRITEPADTARPAAPATETGPEAAEPDERPEPEKLPLDHEAVSAAGVAAPAPPEPERQPVRRSAIEKPEGPRRLPRRG